MNNKSKKLTKEKREELADIYAEQCYEGMDYKCLFQFVTDVIKENLEGFSDEEFEEEMINYMGFEEYKESLD